MAAAVPAKVGSYEIVKHLASGGMAELLLARSRGLDRFERHVVIKQIRAEQAGQDDFVQMFVEEARLAATLHHNNIVQVHDIGEEAGRHYFAMEYVHGEDLRNLLTKVAGRREQIPIQHVVTIIALVAAALHHAHEQRAADGRPLGIVHRDVTPANIILSYDGNVKVVDFGIAKAALRQFDTQAGMLKGKVPYMSPEQCTGQPVDRRGDVFSLGIVLYELATVRRLFKGPTEFATMSAIVRGEVPRPSRERADLPPALEAIILRALARDPADRFQTAEQMHAALEQFAVNSGLRTSSTGLASYMKHLFGERPEPWLVESDESEVTIAYDFDGDDTTGLVMPPADTDVLEIPTTVATTKTSPLVRAQQKAVSARALPAPFAKREGAAPALGAPLPRLALPAKPPGATIAADTAPARPTPVPASKASPAAIAKASADPATTEKKKVRSEKKTQPEKKSGAAKKPADARRAEVATVTAVTVPAPDLTPAGAAAATAAAIKPVERATSVTDVTSIDGDWDAVAAPPPPAVSATEAKPAEAKPVEAKPVDAKPVDAKPVDAKPVEAKPVEAKPAAAGAIPSVTAVKAADAKPAAADSKPTAAAPVAASKPADGKATASDSKPTVASPLVAAKASKLAVDASPGEPSIFETKTAGAAGKPIVDDATRAKPSEVKPAEAAKSPGAKPAAAKPAGDQPAASKHPLPKPTAAVIPKAAMSGRPAGGTAPPPVAAAPTPIPKTGSIPIALAVTPEATSFAVALHEDMEEEPPTIIQPVSAEDLERARRDDEALPSVIVAGGPARDVATEIVKPLRSPAATEEPARARRASVAGAVAADEVAAAPKPRRIGRWIAAAAGVFVISAVIAFGGASRGDHLDPPVAPAEQATKPVAAPEPATEPAPEPPRPERTWANSQAAEPTPAPTAGSAAAPEATATAATPTAGSATGSAAVEPPAATTATATATAAEPTAPPEPDIELEPTPAKPTKVATKPAVTRPAVTKPAITRPAITKPATTRPAVTATRKVQTRPTTTSKPTSTPEGSKPGWNPNALFPKHK